MKRIDGKRESGNGEPGMPSGTGLPGDDMDSRAESIQMLMPLGLRVVGDMLQSEVALLAGAAYSSGTWAVQRWVAAGLMAVAPKPRKVSGHKHLPEPREIMKRELAA